MLFKAFFAVVWFNTSFITHECMKVVVTRILNSIKQTYLEKLENIKTYLCYLYNFWTEFWDLIIVIKLILHI